MTVDQQSRRGILNAEISKRNFNLTRYAPAPDLGRLIENYWIVKWDLTGQAPYRQVILSYPNVNLSFEKTPGGIYTGVYGVPTTTYSRLLQDDGHVLGIKFRPGGFYPLWKKPVSRLAGLSVGFGELFGVDTRPVEQLVFNQQSGEKMVGQAEAFLRGWLPSEPDDNVELIGRIVETVIQEREINKVEDMADRFGIRIRTLQRLFSRYVGVSPKWVIRRYRLQEAAEKMENGNIQDWTKLSLELGYYDQAHFIKDFKAMIGKSPEEYIKDIGKSGENGIA